MIKKELTWDDIDARASMVAFTIWSVHSKKDICISLYGVPRGGVYAAQAVALHLAYANHASRLVENASEADFIIDDIMDSGRTRQGFIDVDDRDFFALVDYQGKDKDLKGTWISFPWERMNTETGIEDHITRLIAFMGDDPEREGLIETPDRVIRSYEKLFGGYNTIIDKNLIKVFKNDGYDEMILMKDIPFFSTCEHHIIPFFGKAHIAYIPGNHIIGISKLVRIMEGFTRRLTIQERICQQITETLQSLLKPAGVACVLEAQHLCMMARGVEKYSSILVTSSLTGVFKEKIETRNEFMSMIGK